MLIILYVYEIKKGPTEKDPSRQKETRCHGQRT
jgi:hypothetical protein